MGKWKVNDGTQVDVAGKMYVGGDTFSATDDELDEFGSRPYVSKVKDPAKAAPDTKAQTSSPNKAQTTSPNKSK